MEPLLILMVAGLMLTMLVLTMVVIAWRADHAVTIKPPLATLGELEAQIRGKKTTLDDLENELKKRRDAIATIAEVEAEVDALVRQKDELLTEWNQLEERRKEVLAMRQETEEAQTAYAAINRDLSDKAVELEQVEARLRRAEELVGRISELEKTQGDLEKAVAELRAEVTDLQALKAREQELRDAIGNLERDTSRVQGEIDSFEARKSEAVEAAQAAQARLEQIKATHTDEAAKLASAETENTRIEAQRAELLAQISDLKKKAGFDQGEGGEEDQLSELKALPPVLEDMKSWPERAPNELETDALHRVATHMRALGLEYHPRVIRAFHTAMKVNESTQMAVLAGISGTGKSQLPRRYAQAMGIGFLQVPVQPRWDSPQDLMGFYNYIEGKFRPTDLARALYHLDKWNGPADSVDLQDRMLLVLLDEMNLARVEYYFSDFLSRLESRPGIDDAAQKELRKDAELELEIPSKGDRATPRIFPGYNVLFAGTMNEDESTQSLSDKVVDRANVMRFAAPRTIRAGNGDGAKAETKALSCTQWRRWVRPVDALGTEMSRVEDHVDRMVGFMTDLGRPFGHRLGRAIMAYAANYPRDNERLDIQTALADQVELRLLPKLRGVEMEMADTTLRELSDYVEKDLSDATLADAIRESVRLADEGSGQFVWRGVTRA